MTYLRSVRKLTIVLLLLFSVAGCARVSGSLRIPASDFKRLSSIDIKHVPTNESVNPSGFLRMISDKSVVFIGEQHGRQPIVRLENSLIRLMNRYSSREVVVGMEMFREPDQNILNQWIEGELSYKRFKKRLDWSEPKVRLLDHYRTILEYCRKHDIKILALNASEDQERLIRENPDIINHATAPVSLPSFGPGSTSQKRFLRSQFRHHVKTQGSMESFIGIQRLWEEHMAERIANYHSKKNEQVSMLVITGKYHVKFGFGIQKKLIRRRPMSYTVVIPGVKSLITEGPEEGTGIENSLDLDFYLDY